MLSRRGFLGALTALVALPKQLYARHFVKVSDIIPPVIKPGVPLIGGTPIIGNFRYRFQLITGGGISAGERAHRLLTRAMAESSDDFMLGRRCRCGCGDCPRTDHYLGLQPPEPWPGRPDGRV